MEPRVRAMRNLVKLTGEGNKTIFIIVRNS